MRTLSTAWSSSRHLPTSCSSSASTSSFGRLEVAQQRRKARRRSSGCRDQPLEVADRQQRVLVDGVLVVEVADDAAGDRLERREHPAEQAAVVHLGQARVEPGARLEKGHQRAAPLARCGKNAANGTWSTWRRMSVERVVGDRQAGVDRRLERAQPGVAAAARRGSRRRSECRRALRPRLTPTGTGAVRRIRSSERATARAWRK